jgi:hypothetical protein
LLIIQLFTISKKTRDKSVIINLDLKIVLNVKHDNVYFIYVLKQRYKRLLNLNATVDANNFNKLLENYGLNNFQHRLFIRMTTFLHNIVNIEQAPKLLKDQIRMNVNINKGGHNLSNKFQVNQPLRIHNHYGLLLLKINKQFYSRRLKK